MANNRRMAQELVAAAKAHLNRVIEENDLDMQDAYTAWADYDSQVAYGNALRAMRDSVRPIVRPGIAGVAVTLDKRWGQAGTDALDSAGGNVFSADPLRFTDDEITYMVI